ncbi:WecB/TagA/CpsF family glycosyltransferase [Algoriphagus halophytocola]|uniref:WecB/TagA/CpsF family glycosyltransferase n=1 Tax=Algoriphagus halophytocola TaxID=2991499 RepID=UPI0022DE51A2|nr:WecB/TagA/CpsF family glycosyltransferase [Algoriphagus sp. TR-M9]WBL41235.1 WecB/TagA/CpsF family glycosyltransferase [Algoriphagus sp. TR-M9]
MINRAITVVDIPLFKDGFDTAVDLVLSEIIHGESSGTNRCISATGAHGIIEAKEDADFKKVLNEFYINLPDGMPGVWVGRAKGAKAMDRCYGPDFFEAMMVKSCKTTIKHFFCGGMEGVADKLKQACSVKFENNNVVGTFCPPFMDVKDYDYESISDLINSSGANIVWVGISSPKQEKFAKYLSQFTQVDFLITVGAAFDFHIGNVKQAPKWMQKSGLEWLFRLSVEPKRLYKRYVSIVPKFAFYGVKDLINYKLKLNK